MQEMNIGNLVDVVGGIITSRISAKEDEQSAGEMKVLIPKAISNGGVSKEDLGVLNLSTAADGSMDKKKLTQEGDIVLKLSTPYDACAITAEDVGLVVPSFCAILRKKADANIDLNYLLAFLNSGLGNSRLKEFVNSATIAILSIGSLKKVLVPQTTSENQKKIGDEYIQQVNQVKLLKKLVLLESEKNDSIFYTMEAENAARV